MTAVSQSTDSISAEHLSGHRFGIKSRLNLFCLSDSEESSILKEAKELGKVMDLNIVRLKFTAYLQDSNGGFTRALKPVVSNAIYDSSESDTPNHESAIGVRAHEPAEETRSVSCCCFSCRVSECLQPENLPDG